MPHATVRYPFEHKLHGWAHRYRGGAGFLAILDEAGAVVSIHDAEATESAYRTRSTDIQARLREECPSWIYYDPFDAPEYAWMAWQNVSRAALEALLGERFSTDDLRDLAQREAGPSDIPTSWDVMF